MKKGKNIKAFPIINGFGGNEGMDLRDYFAAKAMQTLIQQKGLSTFDCSQDTEGTRTDVVEAAYTIADAMMEARKQ